MFSPSDMNKATGLYLITSMNTFHIILYHIDVFLHFPEHICAFNLEMALKQIKNIR